MWQSLRTLAVRSRRSGASLLSGVALVLFLLACYAEAFQVPQWQANLFNADALYLPAFSQDVWVKQHSFREWYLPHSAYYFPDMIIFGFLSQWSLTVEQNVLWFGICLWLLIGGGLALLWGLEKRPHNLSRSLVALAIWSGLLWLSMHTVRGTSGEAADMINSFLLPILSSAHHLGAVWNTLILFWMCLTRDKDINSSKPLAWGWILAFTALAWMSDKIIAAQAILPLFLWGSLRLLRQQSWRWSLIALATGMVLGQQIHDHFTPHRLGSAGVMPGSISEVMQSAFNLKNDFSEALLGPWAVYWGLYSLALALSAYRLWEGVVRVVKKQSPPSIENWQVLCALAIFCNIGVVILKAHYQETAHLRYLLVALLFPWFLLGAMIDDILHRIPRGPSLSRIGLVLLALVAFQLSSLRPWNYRWENKEIACVSAAAAERGISHIVTGYWSAKPLQLFTSKELKVLAVDTLAKPYNWISSGTWVEHWFETLPKDPSLAPDVFLIQDGTTAISDRSSFSAEHSIPCGRWSLYTRKIEQLGLEQYRTK